MGFTKLCSSNRSPPILALIACLLVHRSVTGSPEVSSGAYSSKQKIHPFPVHQGLSDEQRSINRIADASTEQMLPYFSLVNSGSDEEKNGSHFPSHRKKRTVGEAGKSREQEYRENIAHNISHAELEGLAQLSEEGSKRPDSPNHWGNQIFDHDLVLRKRAYSFTPMRGRKRYPDNSASWPETAPDYSAEYIAIPNSNHVLENEYFGAGKNSLVEDDVDKRASYFVPVRGRKDYTNAGMTDGNMKHPRLNSILLGNMNGENDWPSLNNAAIVEDLALKRTSYFQPAQENNPRQIKEQDLYSKVGSDDMSNSGSGDTKRGSSFVPLRGRKDYIDKVMSSSLSQYPVFPAYHTDDSGDVTSRKDSIASGQWIDSHGQEESVTPQPSSRRFKRASSFTPMRGRRPWKGADQLSNSYNPYVAQADRLLEAEAEKRAFYALRGKKEQYNTAVWKRAFHAMRGKKWLEQKDVDDYLDAMKPLDVGMLSDRSSRVEENGHRQDEIRNTKRSPSRGGFSSMRFPQKSRTALVMKRPLSFFATRGKRMDADDNDAIIRATNDLV